jgi:NADH-quinone oxidoreductase subunit N
MARVAVTDVSQYYAGAYLLLPEFLLGIGSALLLLIEAFFPTTDNRRPAYIAGGILIGALGLAFLVSGKQQTLFSGMVVVDPFLDFFRFFSLIAGLLGILIALNSDEVGTRNTGEYYTMFLALVMGMNFMAMSQDLVMIFLSIELVSLMSYVLVGFRRHDRKGSEASLKYVIYGGAASGAMVFGFSLIYGLTKQTELPLINEALRELVTQAARASLETINEPSTLPAAVIAGMVLAFVGFAYKIAAVPLHMWSPDVYEGAPTPFTAFLSTGPKAAGFAVLIRFFIVGFSDVSGFEAGSMDAELSGVPWLLLVVIVSMASMTLGNLAAIGQNNIKRFLAYSSIAHAGYALIGLCAFSRAGAASVLLYMAVYLAMNIGAFYCVIWVREKIGSELIDDYKGLGHRAPLVGVGFTVFLVSLTGLPPMAGFIAKYKLFASALERAFQFEPLATCAQAADLSFAGKLACALSGGGVFYALGVVAVVNSAISLYYYFRVVRKMFLERPDDPTPIPTNGLTKGLLLATCGFVLFFGLFPAGLERRSNAAIDFHTVPAKMKLPRDSEAKK